MRRGGCIGIVQTAKALDIPGKLQNARVVDVIDHNELPLVTRPEAKRKQTIVHRFGPMNPEFTLYIVCERASTKRHGVNSASMVDVVAQVQPQGQAGFNTPRIRFGTTIVYCRLTRRSLEGDYGRSRWMR